MLHYDFLTEQQPVTYHVVHDLPPEKLYSNDTLTWMGQKLEYLAIDYLREGDAANRVLRARYDADLHNEAVSQALTAACQLGASVVWTNPPNFVGWFIDELGTALARLLTPGIDEPLKFGPCIYVFVRAFMPEAADRPAGLSDEDHQRAQQAHALYRQLASTLKLTPVLRALYMLIYLTADADMAGSCRWRLAQEAAAD